ncbi:MAG: hypothetical protein JXP73_06965 [Deltaproteobacteria bacterium]|nr:hypothetical protein [Deltaproteobacteria bacterium]
MTGIEKACCLALLLGLGACASSDSTSNGPRGVVKDTLGIAFDVDCGSGWCRLTPQDANVKPVSCDWGGYGTDTFVLMLSRLLIVHVVATPPVGPLHANAAEPGHPVACDADADCLPPGLGTSSGPVVLSCANGLCQDPTKQLGTNDVMALCQADIPWPTSCPYVTTLPFAACLEEIAAACGASTYCDHVPADCRQVVAAPVAPAIDGGGSSVSFVSGTDAASQPAPAKLTWTYP